MKLNRFIAVIGLLCLISSAIGEQEPTGPDSIGKTPQSKNMSCTQLQELCKKNCIDVHVPNTNCYQTCVGIKNECFESAIDESNVAH